MIFLLAACGGKTPALGPLPAVTAISTPIPVSGNALVITNGTVIDGNGAEPLLDGVVVIEGNRIVAVGRAAGFTIPDEVKVIDARGGTILPGIINAHVHGTADPATRRFAFLLKGVTATCDLAAPLENMSEFARDDTSGPSARGFRSGPIIAAPGGYPDMPGRPIRLTYAVTNTVEAQAAVMELVAREVDVIKIALEPGFAGQAWPVLSVEQVKAIVKAAHASGKLVRAHVTRGEVLDIALEAGVDVIEHVPAPALSEAEWKVAVQDPDYFQFPANYEALLSRMVEGQIVLVPTLSVAANAYEWYDVPPVYKPLAYKLFLEPVRRFHALGGIVALGNDYGNPGAEAGIPVHEMQLLLQAGLTPMEVIQAGTKYAALACGHGDELGVLQPGMLADIIVVSGDPLVDLDSMRRVMAVIKDGQIVFIQINELIIDG